MPDVSLMQLTQEQIELIESCIGNLRKMPFTVTLVTLANMLCATALERGVPRRSVVEMVEHIWDAMAKISTPEAKG